MVRIENFALEGGPNKEIYGSNVCGLLEGGIASCPSNSSRWWKDLVSIEGRDGSYWFNEEVARKVRNGAHTKFWDAKWRGGVRVKYPRLFAMSNQKEATVADIGVFTGSVMDWRCVEAAFLYLGGTIVDKFVGRFGGSCVVDRCRCLGVEDGRGWDFYG